MPTYAQKEQQKSNTGKILPHAKGFNLYLSKKGIFPLPYRFFLSAHIVTFDLLTEYFSILKSSCLNNEKSAGCRHQ